MDYSRMQRGKYLKASELSTEPTVTISFVDLVDMQERDGSRKQKLVLSFRELEQQLVLNRTNGDTLAELLGMETDEWIGKQIVLFTIPTSMGDGIRIKAAQEKTVAATSNDGSENDVPF